MGWLDATIEVPDRARLAAVQRLCDSEAPFDCGTDVDQLFLRAMREGLEWHLERSAAFNGGFYEKLLTSRGFCPSALKENEDLSRIPFIHANFFKTHEVLSIERRDVTMVATSSGTLGQKSQMFFDRWSIGAEQRMIAFMFKHYGFLTPAQPTNYLLFSMEQDPRAGASASKLGTAFTNKGMTEYAPVKQLFWALRLIGAGNNEFDAFGTIRTLQQYAEEGLPVRLLGFPAFAYFTLERMRTMGLPPIRLPEGSMALFGGGWKGHADKAISKPEFYARVEEQLGIPEDRCRDMFGSVEFSVPHVECERHKLHTPVWSRAICRDVRSLEPVGHGKPGFLQLLSPYITSVPAVSVLMGDLVELHPGSDCGCGIERPFFEVLGRAGTSKNRSCALAAAELLRGRTA